MQYIQCDSVVHLKNAFLYNFKTHIKVILVHPGCSCLSFPCYALCGQCRIKAFALMASAQGLWPLWEHWEEIWQAVYAHYIFFWGGEEGNRQYQLGEPLAESASTFGNHIGCDDGIMGALLKRAKLKNKLSWAPRSTQLKIDTRKTSWESEGVILIIPPSPSPSADWSINYGR